MRKQAWLWLLAAIATGVAMCALIVTAVVVDRFGVEDRAEAAPMMVVLGARVNAGGVASDALQARVTHAVDLYRKGLAPRILFSGGVGNHPPSEASVAAALAQQAGVPVDACLLEEGSHSTAQNAELSAAILREQRVDRVILVSDPYHMLRARQYFRRHGIDVLPSPALLVPRHTSVFERIHWTLREALALLVHPSLWFA